VRVKSKRVARELKALGWTVGKPTYVNDFTRVIVEYPMATRPEGVTRKVESKVFKLILVALALAFIGEKDLEEGVRHKISETLGVL